MIIKRSSHDDIKWYLMIPEAFDADMNEIMLTSQSCELITNGSSKLPHSAVCC